MSESVIAPTDDIQDDPALYGDEGASPLRQVLAFFNRELLPVYQRMDREAIRQQRHHRWLVNLATVCGTATILCAALQLGLGRLDSDWLKHGVFVSEMVMLVLGATAVISGVWAARQRAWLTARHRAERLRLLKFGCLADPSPWENPGGAQTWGIAWKAKIAEIATLDFRQIRQWAETDPSVALPAGRPATAGQLPPSELEELRRYYVVRRIGVQSDYFRKSSERYRQRDYVSRRIPVVCFAGSILCALAHGVLELIHESSVVSGVVNNILIVLAISLPAIGAAVRNYRSAHEVARSASLFKAKHQHLVELRKDMDQLHPEDGRSLREKILECETYLESEHREWLWLMLEAEWI